MRGITVRNRFLALDTGCPASLHMMVRAESVSPVESDPELDAIEAALKNGSDLQDQLADLNPLVAFARKAPGNTHVQYPLSLEMIVPGLEGFADLITVAFGESGGEMAVVRRGAGDKSMIATALAAHAHFDPMYEFSHYHFWQFVDGDFNVHTMSREDLTQAGAAINDEVKALRELVYKPSASCAICPGRSVCAVGEPEFTPTPDEVWKDPEHTAVYLKRNVKRAAELFFDVELKPVSEVCRILESLSDDDFKRKVFIEKHIEAANA